ncbi:hypothetical protein QVD17_02962 [Tagetes erecta]|uniref:Uncharacterized protein n=1 Tax=Tagetes erecta TaxID=13708 RepID=A0AAD8P9L6_TARER|nr:hypothetical protein QVD17_02962 [Tagetes erecta]
MMHGSVINVICIAKSPPICLRFDTNSFFFTKLNPNTISISISISPLNLLHLNHTYYIFIIKHIIQIPALIDNYHSIEMIFTTRRSFSQRQLHQLDR